MSKKELKDIHDNIKKLNNYNMTYRDHINQDESLSIEILRFNKKYHNSKYMNQ